MFMPNLTKAHSIGQRRKHRSLAEVPRTTTNISDNRSMMTSIMVSRLNFQGDYQSSESVNKNKQQVAVAFSNNANQLRVGSDAVVAGNRRSLLRKR